MITTADINDARLRIAPFIRRTPVLEVSQVKNKLPHAGRVTLKLEALQVTGSFKARGAMNAVASTDPSKLKKGLVTASGGNHGIAVSRTASAAGVPATIFLPPTASPAKVEKIRRWGAEARTVEGGWDVANRAALAFAEETGATYLHPFADPLVVAGQGTLALEILEELPDIDAILIAIGGGGLISGMATAIRSRRPDLRIIGIEPTGSPTLKASLDAGHVVELSAVTSRVATMSCARTDERIFETVRRTVDEIVLVTDEAMQQASEWLWFECGVAADLSGAASIAALKSVPGIASGAKHVCALICGAGAEGTG
jgi:threonine dehydratase